MLKKFVQINANASPSSNPYEVRTFMGDCNLGPEWTAPCERPVRSCLPQTSTIAKVLTIEDELRRLQQKANAKRAELRERKRKRICPMAEDFLYCVEPQRSPAELKTHAVTREKYLRTKAQLDLRIHDATPALKDPTPSLVKLESPMNMVYEEEEAEEEEDEEGDRKVKLRYATPSCSLDVIFVPPPKVLELKRPKSGLFHNSIDPPTVPDDGIPYVSYNPRELQQKFNDQALPRIDIIDGKSSADMWTWNLGLQRTDSEIERAYMGARVSKFDCKNMDLTVYSIPKDIDKTIEAEVVFGNKNVQPQPEPRKRDSIAYCHRPPEIAALYAAYVETFRLSPDFWTEKTMDVVLALGVKILKRSIHLNYKDEESDFDILKIIPERNAVVDIKVHFTGTLRNEPNIYKALSLYFFKYTAAILVSKNLYVLIWKRCSNSFFIFDPNGRNKKLQRSFIKGKCTLMCTKYVEHLVHLIVNSSGLDMNADFTLYGIVLVNFGKIIGEIPKIPFPKRYRKLWGVVNESYAIIPSSNTGIHQPSSGKTKNASMIVSLFALLYGYIERPPLWTPGVIDDLIRYGHKYHRSLIKRLGLVKRVKRKKKYQHLNITDVPELYMMGAFKARHSKYPFLFSGRVADCNNFLDSQLTAAVRELYANGWESALLQIDNSVLAIWRDNQLFYVFDPFRRGKAGQVLDPDDFLTKGAACLQMHTNFESFCRILHMKAIKMRRGGKLFLHGIRVGCIKPMIKLMYLKNEIYPHLKLDYPTIPMEDEDEDLYDMGEDENEGEFEDEEEEQATAVPVKPRKVRKVLSITTIPEVDVIPLYDEKEVPEQTLAEIICEILEKLPEPSIMPTTGYRQASKVLLRTDKDYLESLKYKLKHGEDFDHEFDAKKHEPETIQPISLEEELLLPSNFEILPDGSWVIFGHAILPVVEEDVGKLGALLSCLIAVVLSAKYCIATWGHEMVDFALESVNSFGEQFKDYEYVLSAILSKKIPDVQIGDNCYCLGVHKIIRSGVMQSLRQVLLECLYHFNRFLVICQRYSCVIIRRHNFLYMFVGFACNTIGYRKFSDGPACLLRFVELDSLIRRLEYGCNPQGCEISNYIIVAMKVADITGGGDYKFRDWRDKEQDLIYDNEYEKYMSKEERRKAKRDFLNSELSKETKRIDRFIKDKKSHKERIRLAALNRCKKIAQYKPGGPDYTDYLMQGEEDEGMEAEEEEIPIQHKPGIHLPREVPDKFKPLPVVYGYRRRNTDKLFKIQGTKALDDRMSGAIDEIKACFFTSALAVLYAVLRPLNEWTPQRMDRVIEQGKQITKRISNFKTANRRMLKNVTVDDYEMNVWVKVYEVPGVWGFGLNYQIDRALQTRRYVLLQISNCTFVIYRDQVYHLFDPYPSMEKAGQDDDNEEEEEEESEPNEAVNMTENNQASWVLFADVQSLLKYIDKRALNPDWQNMFEFHFHVVDIANYRKAPAQSRMLQLLTDISIPMVCKTSPHSEDETDVCAHNENLCWLEMENSVPIWSRLNRRNASGKYRNLPVSKAKKYDVEIDGRLWSLWGTLHPMAPCFPPESRGKQFLACNVLACCAARIYRLADWSCQLLDNIIISGDKYHRDSLKRIVRRDYEFSLEDLNLECELEKIKFVVHLEHVAYGRVYCIPSAYQMNLAEGLMYFFGHFQFGILQVRSRSLAIGRILDHDGGYFMFDCQSHEHPLFPMGQGAAYLLRTRHLQVLLYCITVALAIPHHNVQYTLHKVEILRKGAVVEEEEEDEGAAGGAAAGDAADEA